MKVAVTFADKFRVCGVAQDKMEMNLAVRIFKFEILQDASR